MMKPYLLSLGAGLLVGVVYSLLDVRSPAPPVVALVGLLGILLGEQIVPVAKRLMAGHPPSLAVLREECTAHLFGPLPGRAAMRPEQDGTRERAG
ncbi:XapX domain-containing protein [Pseudoroseomonas cervicalis]|uniref:XapX domain-containing protein n=1 Tax=Teichococcus cervicalis TaxID=204525 RepID=UPI0022F14819|nr:XapX domain-containing protein [Pseudoroseomonas cervicalis]WBV41569.1 XapX domain-containing protein [Pseudoroseomonas cervicalis]